MEKKVNIICHRGFWKKKSEQNKIISIKKAIDKYYGIEIDLRDLNNEIIISHDPYLSGKKLNFKIFVKKYYKIINKNNTILALNIKSDGIYKNLKKILIKYNINNYFVFDMTIPETLNYKVNKIKFYERYSCYETNLHFNKYSNGVWIDSFNGKFVFSKKIKKKKMCFVSPELHKKNNFKSFWKKIKKLKLKNQKIYLCTDYPNLANKYFND